MGGRIKVEMDAAQVLWYLEGCARGSHLRQGCWHDMIRLYPKMPQNMRDFLYTYAKRDIAPLFGKSGIDGCRRCGAEDFDQFLACFDKNNRYMVTAIDGMVSCIDEAYLYKGRYYTSDMNYFAEEYVTKTEKIEYENF